MDSLFEKWFILAGLVYALLQFLKPVYDVEKHKWNFDVIASLVLGITLTVFAEVDVLALAGVYISTPYVGEVLSGILVGGAVGAGFIHDFPPFLKGLLGK